METVEIINAHGMLLRDVPVTEWFRGDVHPKRDGWYQFLMYGSAPAAIHMREYRAGAWRSLNNSEAKFSALPLDRWRGLIAFFK